LAFVISLIGIAAAFYLGPSPFDRILAGYDMRDFTLPERVLTEFRVVLRYISLLVFPHPSRLNLDYDFALSRGLLDPLATLFSILVIGGLLVLALSCARKYRIVSFAVLWFLGNLVIESSFIGLEVIFEHRTYLPSMFISVIPVLLICRYTKQRVVGYVAVFLAVAFVFSLWTYQRTGTWGNARLLWQDCVKKSPGKARPHVNLGVILYEEGRLDEAVLHFRRALEINANYAPAHNAYGAVLLKRGKLKEAVNHFSRAVGIDPDYRDARENLRGALERLGRPGDRAQRLNQEAIGLAAEGKLPAAAGKLAEALRLRPEFAEAHYNLGNIVASQGKQGEAIAHFSEAVRIRPDYAEAHNNLGISLAKQGKINQAIEHFSEALRLNPDFSEARKNLNRAKGKGR
jgi:tetratricopeptide (TPR) repeat protein